MLWEHWKEFMGEFLSTPSARRATSDAPTNYHEWYISIHALREEGDFFGFVYPV